MIFATIGTQEPFDRLVSVIDEMAKDIDERIVVQAVGCNLSVKNVELVDFLQSEEYYKLFTEARLIIAHAGMGTVISAMTNSKPIIIMPRKCSLGEHRNEHQLATSKKLKELGYIYVAEDELELKKMVLELLSKDDISVAHTIGKKASPELVKSISDFIIQKKK